VTDAGAGERQLFSPRTGLALALVGVFAFSAFVTLLAYAPDLQRNPFCAPDVYSKCAVGFAGLKQVAQSEGAASLISRAPLPVGRNQGLLIVTPQPGGGADVGALRFSGPILVVLPKWRTHPDPVNFAWGVKDGLLDPKLMPNADLLDVVKVTRRSGVARRTLVGQAGTPFGGLRFAPGAVESLQTLQANGWTAVLTDEKGQIVMAEAPSSRIFVLADPDFLNTQGLADLDTFGVAIAIVRTLRAGDGPLIFDATLAGYKQDRTPLKLMFDPPFLAVTLCVAAALALAGWQALFRFGPLKRSGRALALGKEGLVDNSAQLIRLARREPSMAPRYAALTRTAAAKAVGAPRDLTGEALTGFLDRIGRKNGAGTLAALTAEADHVRDRAALTALAGRLYRWRLEMTRERH
jgi:hypothetical protein